jgi:hypothetical protein
MFTKQKTEQDGVMLVTTFSTCNRQDLCSSLDRDTYHLNESALCGQIFRYLQPVYPHQPSADVTHSINSTKYNRILRKTASTRHGDCILCGGA